MSSSSFVSRLSAAGLVFAAMLVASPAAFTPAAAQSRAPQGAAAGPPGGQRAIGPWVFSLSGGGVHQSRTDLDDSSGDFNVTRSFIQGSGGYAFNRRTSVSLSLGLGEADYGFSDTVSIGGGKPWGRIRDYRVSLPVRFGVGDRGNAIVVPSLRSFAEKGASLDDGRTEGLLAGFGWRFSERLEIGPGVGWFSSIGDDSQLIPILVIDWDITDRLKLSTGGGLAATQGPGLTLDWRASDKVTIGLTGRYERVRFRLDDDGPAPGGIGQDESFPLVLTLGVAPWPTAQITAFAGVEFAGELRLENAQGDHIDTTKYDPAPLLGLSFRARF